MQRFSCKLGVVAKARELDLYDVYSDQFGPIPWSNAEPHGTLYRTDKSKLQEEFENHVGAGGNAPAQAVWVVVLSANIQTLKRPGEATTCRGPQSARNYHHLSM